ncbi:MAG: bifunctional nicotinamide-nucleotide adenylyltransferase/Nudix hydroxylase [Gammaproteobacteria bacterium]|nr:bifunctional nicotinamide-nucleotide adenylyltransferase/Nudix hydroxylase [Gammaproteobacteria bacterium]
MTNRFDYLIYIGRFQPFHNGHLVVLRRALEQSDKVIVVLGSARRARNIKNPFSDTEREQMIRAAVDGAEPQASARLVFCSVRDYYDDAKWEAAVRKAVSSTIGLRSTVGIIGHTKDDSSYYLKNFPEWQFVSHENESNISATDLRCSLFSVTDISSVKTSVPPSIMSFLEHFKQSAEFAELAAEHETVKQYKSAWSVAPYPPVFVTVDAVVRAKNHILLIQRGRHPGKGQWALPGGFVDQRERLIDATIRELNEETKIGIERDVLKEVVTGHAVFDHPDRSVRGRTIAHAFFFDLDIATLPTITASDDAAFARWIPTDELLDREVAIFEDHLHIIDRFLNVLETTE